MKILNLYAGIGGNRKFWGKEHQVTAVEINPTIAAVYKHYFPNDIVIVADAHDFLINHYSEYDFIWLSRSCKTHSRANFWASRNKGNRKKYYPDFGLYEEITFLQHWYDGDFVAENVIPYYSPLIEPTKKLGRHIFWANFEISDYSAIDADIHKGKRDDWKELFGFDLSAFKLDVRKDQVYRNCVHPATGLHILNCALGEKIIL